MKYLALLVFLMGCNSVPKYKAGDCFRLITTLNIGYYTVYDVTTRNYLISNRYRHDKSLYESDELIVLPISYVDKYTDSNIVDCNILKRF